MMGKRLKSKNRMISLLFSILLLAGLTLLIRQIIQGNKKEVISEVLLADGQMEFTLSQSGKYTIWNKRIKRFTSEKRGINAYHYTLFNKQSGQEIELKRQRDSDKNPQNNTNSSTENRWRTMHAFDVPAGTYLLKFERADDAMSMTDGFKGLGIFNPFKEMNPNHFTIAITPFHSKEKEMVNGLLVALYVILTVVSLILFLNSFHK